MAGPTLLHVTWVSLVGVGTLTVAASVAAIAFGQGILPFLLFAALPISFFLARSNLLRESEQPRANTDAPDSLEPERAIALDGARDPRARNL